MPKYCLAWFVLTAVICLSGCATNAESSNMVYQHMGPDSPKNSSLIKNIEVKEVSGGQETNPLWLSSVNDASFKDALTTFLVQSNLAKASGGSRYALDAQLLDLDKPLFGFNMTSTCQIHYRLYSMVSQKVLYDKNITTSYTATINDTFFGVRRVRLANEGAINANIKKLMNDLYNIN